MFDFVGKTAFITGGASGAGLGQAKVFAAAGCRVIVADIRQDAIDAALAELRAGGAQAHGIRLDITDRAAFAQAADEAESVFGPVHLLFNTAGVSIFGPLEKATYDDYDWIMGVNWWGVVNSMQTFVPRMLAHGQGGHIVNTASAAAYQPSRALPAYSTSKAAVLMLSECLRAELAERSIGVSAICPGVVNTNITATARFAGADAAEEKRLQQRTGRLYGLRNYPPEKVADAIIEAVVHNRAVVPVTPEARAARFLSRFSPGALRGIARLKPPL